MMQTKIPSLEQTSLASLIDTYCVCSIAATQVANCFFELSDEMNLTTHCDASESQIHRSNLDHSISSSQLVSCYSKCLRESSRQIVSIETNWTELDKSLSSDRAIQEECMSLSTFDEGSDLGDDMDIDDILSILSDDNVALIQVEQRHSLHEAGFASHMEGCARSISPQPIDATNICSLKTTTGRIEEIWSTLNFVQRRLHESMKESLKTQAGLQEWDRLNGLPASHSRTMMNTARSRKQLQEGVILKKWNGSPLVKTSER